ncbi:MAG TPA: MaoC family dehydratase [Terriglobia bacterium]|nr:MaoC family dehydratase [Terriglobia bacterium]
MPQRVIETPAALKRFAGREIATTEWFLVTQDRILQFAEVSEDRQWIHVDAGRAQSQSPYSATVAHGFLTLSLLSCFLRQAIEIRDGVRLTVNYGLNRVRFPAPVRAGSKIRARVTLLSLNELRAGVEAVFSMFVEAEGAEKPCCVAEWVVRYYQ